MHEIIDLTKDLIQFKTTHANSGEIKRCAAFIEQYLNTFGIEYQRFDHEKFPSILISPQNGVAPVLLMSHIDVVDAPDEMFRPVEKNQKLYGRGALDDKYAVALSMILLKQNLQQLQQQGRGQKDLPFGVLITSDEEIGGFNGAKKMLGDIQTDFCIVLDGGSIEKIVVKEKGVVRVRLLSKVKSESGEMSWVGEDVVERLMDDFMTMRTCFVRSVSEHRHRAVIFNSIHAEESHHGRPEHAEACLEIRYTETDAMERLFNKMQNELHSELVVETVQPLFPGGESEHLRSLLDTSRKTRIGFEDGDNDARFLSQFGIKGIVWGADGNRSRHTLHEHVDIESVYAFYGLLQAFFKRCDPAYRG